MQGFPLQSRGEERPELQYSEASVWSLVDHVKTQRRLGPSGLLHWGEAGIGHVGQIRHSDQCPKSLHLKRPNGKEAGLEIKQGWHMCKRKKSKDTYAAKSSEGEKGRMLNGPIAFSSSSSRSSGPQEKQQHIRSNNCSYFPSCQQRLL